MIEHGSLGYRQAEAHAARFCRTEWRENLCLNFLGNTTTIVLDEDLHVGVGLVFYFANAHLNRRDLLGRGLDRVLDQVRQAVR